jgi:hypothetical protein
MRINKCKIYFLQLVHTNVCRTMQIKSLGGDFNFLIFIDDRTGLKWVYFLINKIDVLNTSKISYFFLKWK